MAKNKDTNSIPTEEQVNKFEMLSKLIDSIYTELKDFAKKKPDEILNKFKVKTINRVLKQVKEILSSEPTIEFLDLLDDETIPSNSDAVLIISQFKVAKAQFKSTYFIEDPISDEYRWNTKEKPIKDFKIDLDSE